MKPRLLIFIVAFLPSFVVFSQTYKERSLYQAIYNDDFDAMKQSILDGANINGTLDTLDFSPLSMAISMYAEGKNIELINWLIENGAEPNHSNTGDNGSTPVLLAAHGGLTDILQMMIKYGANLNITDIEGHNLMHIAAINNDVVLLNWLIDHDVELNLKDNIGLSPLIYACYKGYKPIVKILLDNKVPYSAYVPSTLNWIPGLMALLIDNDVSRQKTGAVLKISPLLYAALPGENDVVQLLVEYGADANAQLSENMHLIDFIPLKIDNTDILKFLIDNGAEYSFSIYVAVWLNDMKWLKKLIRQGYNINETYSEQLLSPLMLACESGNLDIATYLVENGADVNLKDSTGMNALAYCLYLPETTIAEYLITQGADVDAANDEGTLLIHAVKEENISFVKLLLKNNAYINKVSKEGFGPLFPALVNWNPELMQILIENGADINWQDADGRSLLVYALFMDNYEAAQFLLLHGIDVDLIDNEGHTPLMHAAFEKKLQMANLFLNNSANVNAIDDEGNTPIHHASSGGNVEIVKMLHQRGADLDQTTKEKLNTPLIYACKEGHFAAAEYLIRQGAKVNISDYLGNTPLFYTADGNVILQSRYDDMENEMQKKTVKGESDNYVEGAFINVLSLLIENGADPNSVNKGGQMPLTAAIGAGCTECVEVLIKGGADPELRTNNGFNSLLVAVIDNQPEVLETLLQNGSRVNAQNDEGITALHVAVYQQKEECVRILLEMNADVKLQDNTGNSALDICQNADIRALLESSL